MTKLKMLARNLYFWQEFFISKSIYVPVTYRSWLCPPL